MRCANIRTRACRALRCTPGVLSRRALHSVRGDSSEVVGMGPATTAPIRIDERVLHYLTGVNHLDSRLRGIVAAIAGTATRHCDRA